MPSPIIVIPGMLKPLKQARLHGYLIERHDGVYHLGGTRPACSISLARMMVEGGWLVKHGPRYEPTERGLEATEPTSTTRAQI